MELVEPMETTYECPIHKTTHQGVKRDTFEKELFDSLLMATMETAYRLYRDVKHGCHCPSNYKAFDTILEGAKQAHPKETTTTTKVDAN
jgi:hypothetical protein